MSSNASLRRWLTLGGIKAMIAGAPRVEFEHAILRVVISALVLMYVAWHVRRDGIFTGDEAQALIAAFAFFAFASAITVLTLQAQSISKARRVLGIVVDNAVATYVLVVLGEDGAVILAAYLFVTLGNGFRYGRFYLRTSQILSVVGFSLVMLVSPFWSQHPAVGFGFLLTLTTIPSYVGVLLERINVARQRAEDANRAERSKRVGN